MSFSPQGGTSNANNGKAIVLNVSTVGYADPTLTYAAQRTSTGFTTHTVEYSTDGTNYTNIASLSIPGSFGLQTVSFAAIAAADDNPNFKVRITLSGSTAATSNNRIDNLKLSGTDAAAPIFPTGYPTTASTTASGFTALTKLNEAGKTYFVVVANNATAPTVAEVKAGQSNGGGTPLASATITTAADVEGSSAVTGLAAGTNYDVYFVAEDNVAPTPNTQTVATKVDVTTLAGGDVIPPSFATGSPSISGTTVSGFTLSSTIDEVGRTYYVVLLSGAAAPTAAQVKAGQDASGTTVTIRGSFANPSSNTAATASITGLAGSTAYTVYVVAEDATPNLQANPVALNVTTLTPPPAITGLNPTIGPVGTSVTISGTNLNTITSVTFGGVAATNVSATATAVTATVAAGTPVGAAAVVLSDGTTTYAAGTFTVTAAPGVATTAASAITTTSATSGGTITGNNATITGRGVVYGTAAAPRIGGSGVGQVTATGTTGTFTSSLPGLTPGTIYFVAAYVISEFGTTYGPDQTFTTSTPPSGFFEDFETATPIKTSYASGPVTTANGVWTFDQAAVGNLANDKKNGTKAARLRGGSIYMTFNKANGAGIVTINAASYGSDATSSYAIDVSDDDGATFTAYNGATTPVNGTLSATAFTVNVAGNIRLRVRHVGGTIGNDPRLNIDDISITDFGGSGTAITAPTFTGTSFCSTSASTVAVEFTPSGTFAATNDFTVQLSNAAGSFASPVVVGTVADNAANGTAVTASITIPAGTVSGTGYKLRIVANDPTTIGTASAAFTLVNAPTVAVAPATTQNLITNTNGAPLTATETPAAITRQWYYSAVSNGSTTAIAGATGTSYTPNFPTAGSYYVTVVSTFAACGSVTSNEVLVTVTAPVATLTATPNALTLDATIGQSTVRNYQLEGSNLAANASVNVSSNNASVTFSIDGGSSYVATATLTASATGSVNQTVRVRFTAPATAGTTNATISNTSGALSAPVAVTGNATEPPVGTPFTPGNLALVRVGDGSAALTSAAAPVFIDEYTPSGTLVRSIALPTSAVGSNFALTANGSSSTNGTVTLSPNRQYISLAGFNAAPGTTSVATATGVERVVGLVDFNGVVNTSTLINDGYLGGDIRSAVTTDGSGFWTAGNGSGSAANIASGGSRYVALGSTGTSTQLSGTPANTRQAAIYFDQLYMTSASGSNIGVNTVGTGVPTTGSQASTLMAGLTATDAYGFVFFDLTDAVAGPDVVYVADGGSGIRKYSLVGSTWVQNGATISGGTGLRGLAASRVANGIRLFAANASNLYTVLDNVAYNVAPATTTLTSLATAPTNQAFRGIAFAPSSPVVLPVSLASFTAERQSASVAIRWTTALEQNSAHFEVQRSVNGKDFSKVVVVAAQGQSTRLQHYTATDLQPARQLAYYRLQQVDTDGKAAYSPVVAVQAASEVQLFPNPVQDVLTVQLPQTEVGETLVQVTDLAGRVLFTSKLNAANQVDMRVLAPGTYLVYIGEGTARITRKVVKH
ncbi:T9SS type A sorting domain-containing protein [Hymenobacter lucidus]|uniref:T9SS type A sorting domain-containing protein n=1 Tax=Hymenobacter lucidus TaxID=2880930 RepID=A0ABS8ARY3_9BACT|nr:T9SS type A sorting domain-containing protein [Hymenobacter lucidus]MCB2408983.1 T9SS type A sorting domain-containing protein [Hymenobacter lucidus]